MYKILANDGIDKSAESKLIELGYSVDTAHYEGDELIQKIQEVDCIIVRSATKVRVPLIDAALQTKQLKLIIRAGVGIDNIDHEYAKEKGIIVRNTPNSSSDAVAELALGHMLALARNIYIANVTMRAGEWNKKQYKGIEINGKKLGLVGFGRIAQSLAKKAYALGMEVQYYDILGENKQTPEYKYVTIDELLATSDFISIHIPFFKEQGPFFTDEIFNKMKDGMYLIHTARGGVVQEDALLRALNSGKVRAAALDVFEKEPLAKQELLSNPNLSLTPHIGASTKEAQARIGLETIEVIKQLLN